MIARTVESSDVSLSVLERGPRACAPTQPFLRNHSQIPSATPAIRSSATA